MKAPTNQEFTLRSLQEHPMTHVPFELWVMIRKYLESQDMVNLLSTNRYFYRVFTNILNRAFRQELLIDFQMIQPAYGIKGFLLSNHGKVYCVTEKTSTTIRRAVSLHSSTETSHKVELGTEVVADLPPCRSIAFNRHYHWGFAICENGDVYVVRPCRSKIYLQKVDSLSHYHIDDISLSHTHAIALTRGGDILASGNYWWQANAFYGVPEHRRPSVLANFEYIDDLPMIKAIATGDNHSVFLSSLGKVYTIATNQTYGQAGQTQYHYGEPRNFKENTFHFEVKAIACGDYHTVIMDTKGNVYGAGYGYAMGLKEKKVRSFTKLTDSKADSINATDSITVINAVDGHSYYAGIEDKNAIFEGFSAFPFEKFASSKPVRAIHFNDYHKNFLDRSGGLFVHNRATFWGGYDRVNTSSDMRNQEISSRIPIEVKTPLNDIPSLIDELFDISCELTRQLPDQSIMLSQRRNLLSDDSSATLKNMAIITLSWLSEVSKDKKSALLSRFVELIREDKTLLHSANLCHWKTHNSLYDHDLVFNMFSLPITYTNPLAKDGSKNFAFSAEYLRHLLVSYRNAADVKKIPDDIRQLIPRLYNMACELTIKASDKDLVALLLSHLEKVNLPISPHAKIKAISCFFAEANKEKSGHLLMKFVEAINHSEALLHLVNLCHWRTKASIDENDLIFNRYTLPPRYENPMRITKAKNIQFYKNYLRSFLESLDARYAQENVAPSPVLGR